MDRMVEVGSLENKSAVVLHLDCSNRKGDLSRRIEIPDSRVSKNLCESLLQRPAAGFKSPGRKRMSGRNPISPVGSRRGNMGFLPDILLCGIRRGVAGGSHGSWKHDCRGSLCVAKDRPCDYEMEHHGAFVFKTPPQRFYHRDNGPLLMSA